MNIVILRSVECGRPDRADDRYLLACNTRYAERVIGHLRNASGFCTACGPSCAACRKSYALDHSKDIAAIADIPSVLPYVLEDPASFVPSDIQPHDVLLAIAVHEQILVEVLKAAPGWGTRGVVVPLEAPDWISPAAKRQAQSICEHAGIEIAFPKPFCAFAPPAGSFLAEFRRHFKIGRPEVALDIRDGVIRSADVGVSAACGATYAVAHAIEGRRVGDNLKIEVISRRFHAYPCTASMERDPELDGDTPLHIAAEAHEAMLAQTGSAGAHDSDTIVTPLGKVIPRPMPAKEAAEDIAGCRERIIALLQKHGPLPMSEIKAMAGSSPAVVNAALLMLSQNGQVGAQGRTVTPSKDHAG